MTILYVMTGVSLAVSLVNLAAVLFLSNSLFRLLVREGMPPPPMSRDSSGLVDPRPAPTYDPRFRA